MFPGWKERWIVVGGCAIAMLFPVPVINILAVHSLWRRFREGSSYIEHQLRANLNFQISIQVYLATAAVLLLGLPYLPEMVVPGVFEWLRFPLGMGMMGITVLLLLTWFTIFTVAFIFAFSGKLFQYPFSLRWIK